jgi:hypothetical protein
MGFQDAELLAMQTAMNKLAKLLLEHPELAREFPIPCALWGLVEREDDESLTGGSPVLAEPLRPNTRPRWQ